MKKTGIIAVFAAGAAGPAAAAPGSFFSLGNTDFIVTIAFLIFVGILIYYKVPTIIGDLLDKRAGGIRRDLDEAKRQRRKSMPAMNAGSARFRGRRTRSSPMPSARPRRRPPRPRKI